ncbi:hypothetical protein [Deinococcus kurensis]|uniref:hypothetical protein n=1 Tax=Deinococcus kurensis TaxID=2662757 RepID=UPI0012D2E203|nr:hypothetical protein [Deinococcus kurensis]
MTVAAFVHPFNPVQAVLVCQGGHLSPALQVKLVALAARETYQIVLVGQQHPPMQAALGTPVAAFTPEAIRADVVAVPSAQHALAHVRATTRHTFILHSVGDVIATYAAALRRPERERRHETHLQLVGEGRGALTAPLVGPGEGSVSPRRTGRQP